MADFLTLGWQGIFTLGLVLVCFTLLARTRIAPDIVTSGVLTLLLVSGILTPIEALAGFSNPGMLTVAVLYVVVSGLTETGAVGWISQSLLGRPRGATGAQLRLMLPVAGLSAFLNNTPVVAIFIPAVTEWAKRNRLQLSKLLIPLSYASIAGGACTLIGTSTNLVVNGLYVERTGAAGLGLFELAWIGLPVVVTVVLFLVLAGRWLLPTRPATVAAFEDVRRYTVEMLVEPNSPLAGKRVEQAGLRQLPGLFLIEIERQDRIIPAVSSQELLHQNDRLVFAGVIDSVMDLQRIRGLVPATNQVFKLDGPRRDRCFVEVVLSNKCPLIGQTVREGRFRARYNAVIIALSRNGERVCGKIGDIALSPGDTLLLESHPEFVLQQRDSRDFLVVSQLGDQHPLNHQRAPLAITIVVAMVAAAGSGFLSMLEAALLAAGAMIMSGCTPGRVARRAPDRQVLTVIATSFGIGAALEKTGVATLLAGSLIGLAQGGPWLSLVLVFVVTALLTAVATNNVAAVLAFPIALDTAMQMGVDPTGFMVVVMIAASASFATPIGYQTNLMVYSVGGYRFSDFVRVGTPLTMLVGLVTILLVPLIWPF
ncbi:SLC13 family permease [Thiorhodovibrio frisius]|uniref:Di-/tricarboxylate transporter n=1 Tax=Thiorhodovibrio frisius TaxID=631362 RepID=H8Z2A7_9GAMM|nr:SLC13 family permease [Thiorhodovibrio frisius]EIC22669.1 di-/tricarboxylate transporter [Thiorhodovibrio frisius]WPL22425.1 transporter, divalent anion:Na+ symporter (DASS) family [Thiorhodovibrio frisius]